MPIITLQGIPSDTNKVLLNNIRYELKRVVANIKELGITSKGITCLFPADLLAGQQEHQRTEIIIRVDGLFIKPERTASVKDRLAEKLLAPRWRKYSRQHSSSALCIPLTAHRGSGIRSKMPSNIR